ncbi:MAG: ferredoxin [Gammaproteobacteria bacterium]|nr:ferredoxin [Gammaproteobacteria bacterium]
MKICIDKSKCQGQKRCFNLYPELFEEGEDGKGLVRIELVSEEDEVDAQSAANACPNAAIVIEY